MSAWQPIATAPKDGTEIILGFFNDAFVDPIVINSCWIDGEERGCYWADWHDNPAPTHWMPLERPGERDDDAREAADLCPCDREAMIDPWCAAHGECARFLSREDLGQ